MEADESPDVIPGDVIITLTTHPHPLFKRSGDNLAMVRARARGGGRGLEGCSASMKYHIPASCLSAKKPHDPVSIRPRQSI